MTDEEFVRACFERFLHRAPDPAGLAYYVERLRQGADRLDVVQGIVIGDEFLGLLHRQAFGRHVGDPALSFAPPGHFYSPLPSRDDVRRYAAEKFSRSPDTLAGLDLNVPGQLALLERLGPLTLDLIFTDDRGGPSRFWWENDGFSPGDATVLAAMLRHFRPRRIIEAGAGYSTAVMLDVVEHHLDYVPEIACIDPEPQRLRALLRGTETYLTVHETIVQDLPLSFFTALEANDLLFIDSSHVLKLGSDVAFLLLEVLPRLARGVIVHVHDVATAFEYPREWYEEGRSWNEAPALRAFLLFNPAFEILYFCDYLNRFRRDAVARHMPLALRQPRAHPGGNTAVSFWMRRARL
jgi:predicted O-methyltransferase YrrM